MNAVHDVQIERELRPFAEGDVHGVTFDGALVWFARNDELVALDPNSEQVVRRLPLPGADAGTAFDGEHLYQIAGFDILVVRPSDGRVLRTLRSPTKAHPSGLAYADGHLFIGEYRELRIHKVDAETGELVKTLKSDRFVTGVTCVDGALWHGVSGGGQPPELRRLAADGTIEETLRVDVEHVSGVEATGDGAFWCGGERGTLRRVRRR